MAAVTLFVGSIGVDITVPLTDPKGNPVDLSEATGLFLYLKSPLATVGVPKTSRAVGSGKEGILIYTTVAGDLDVPGRWLAQVKLVYAAPTREWWTPMYPFTVETTLAVPTS